LDVPPLAEPAVVVGVPAVGPTVLITVVVDVPPVDEVDCMVGVVVPAVGRDAVATHTVLVVPVFQLPKVSVVAAVEVELTLLVNA
jgi:hypothetical protein